MGAMEKMIRKIAITIMARQEILYKIYEQTKNQIYPPLQKECTYEGQGNLKLILDEDSPAYADVLRICEANGLEPYISQWVHYSPKEISQVSFFQMSVATPLEREGTTSSYYGTRHEGGCPSCGLGKKPTGDVLVDRKFLKGKQIGCLYPELFVSEDVKTLIERQGFTGVSFSGMVRDYKDREMSGYYVMHVHHILPPMSDSTWLYPAKHVSLKQQCEHHIVYLRSDIQYEKEHLHDACDFNLTREYLDNFRMQKIVVSRRVRECFQKAKIRVGYFPIVLI